MIYEKDSLPVSGTSFRRADRLLREKGGEVKADERLQLHGSRTLGHNPRQHPLGRKKAARQRNEGFRRGGEVCHRERRH